jgi:Cof subfamily protein (haloacid dehalogenase superfamily)
LLFLWLWKIIHPMKLNFFFDIDGTLSPVGKSVPESAMAALLKAKGLGHRLFFCTGRSQNELTEEMNSLPFDGGVFSAGAGLILEGKTIAQKVMTEEQKRFLAKITEEYKLLLLNQGLDGSYLTHESLAYYRELDSMIHMSPISLNGFKIVDKDPFDIPIIKSFIMSREGRILEARKALEGPFHSVNNTTGLPETCAAELMVAGVTKASGIRELVEYLGDDMASTVGIGDGENDLEMIDVCNLGIAMGNSCDILKQHSDYITTDIEKDGLAKAIDYALERLS